MNSKSLITVAAIIIGNISLSGSLAATPQPVDQVDPYIGNISHLLVPTFPTIHLPNSMLRVYPERSDFTGQVLNGLPVVVTHHRERSAFNLSACQSGELKPVVTYTYDNEHLTPYSYEADLMTTDTEEQMHARYAVSHQSAVYSLTFDAPKPATILLNSRDGMMEIKGNSVTGSQKLSDNTTIYLCVEFSQSPEKSGILSGATIDRSRAKAEGRDVCAALQFPASARKIDLRYGISLISAEQARRNLHREIKGYDIDAVAAEGRRIWNETLGKISVEGGSPDDTKVFYTSLYRTYERPVCLSEDGRYFSAYDGKVHDDGGIPFYTDDWIWDTYRANHPLRILLEQPREEAILESYLRMAEQMGNKWMPTFPEITGDSRRMNSNHAVASVADAMAKGLRIDTLRAYDYCRRGIEEKTLAPWSAKPAGDIDRFYKTHGYIPALHEGEEETDPVVHGFEKRQPVAVTLGTSYDHFCLSLLARALGRADEADHYRHTALNYRNIFNPETSFFHPKDKDGNWIEPFDYRWSGGVGVRNAYDENNGWVYRWDVPHNVADLISLMGGRDKFVRNLDATFRTPLGQGKREFYWVLPDHTGNVGQFSMANEPSLHIPYLYNYAGAPWKTQKCIRQMLRMWFRPDLMGIPGDEDGGGLTSFVVFSSLGFYPVTPGIPAYNIGSPLFKKSKVKLSNGKIFEIEARNVSRDNKYIQSAILNGKEWNKPWFSHSDIAGGGKLILIMGDHPNISWGADPRSVPPSME